MPKPGQITVWEHPEDVPLRDWSPFASRTLALHQLGVIVANFKTMRDYVGGFDYAGTALFVLAATPLLLVLFRRRGEDMFRTLWVASIFAIWCGGLLFGHVEERYVLPVLWPVACAWCFQLGGYLAEWARFHSEEGRARTWGIVVVTFLALSFGVMALERGGKLVVQRPHQNYRALAHELRLEGCEGPIAGTKSDEALYFAYHLKVPCLGAPASGTAGECARELDRFGAKTFLVWEDSSIAGTFSEVPGWTRVATLDASRLQSTVSAQVFTRASRD